MEAEFSDAEFSDILTAFAEVDDLLIGWDVLTSPARDGGSSGQESDGLAATVAAYQVVPGVHEFSTELHNYDHFTASSLPAGKGPELTATHVPTGLASNALGQPLGNAQAFHSHVPLVSSQEGPQLQGLGSVQGCVFPQNAAVQLPTAFGGPQGLPHASPPFSLSSAQQATQAGGGPQPFLFGSAAAHTQPTQYSNQVPCQPQERHDLSCTQTEGIQQPYPSSLQSDVLITPQQLTFLPSQPGGRSTPQDQQQLFEQQLFPQQQRQPLLQLMTPLSDQQQLLHSGQQPTQHHQATTGEPVALPYTVTTPGSSYNPTASSPSATSSHARTSMEASTARGGAATCQVVSCCGDEMVFVVVPANGQGQVSGYDSDSLGLSSGPSGTSGDGGVLLPTRQTFGQSYGGRPLAAASPGQVAHSQPQQRQALQQQQQQQPRYGSFQQQHVQQQELHQQPYVLQPMTQTMFAQHSAATMSDPQLQVQQQLLPLVTQGSAPLAWGPGVVVTTGQYGSTHGSVKPERPAEPLQAGTLAPAGSVAAGSLLAHGSGPVQGPGGLYTGLTSGLGVPAFGAAANGGLGPGSGATAAAPLLQGFLRPVMSPFQGLQTAPQSAPTPASGPAAGAAAFAAPQAVIGNAHGPHAPQAPIGRPVPPSPSGPGSSFIAGMPVASAAAGIGDGMMDGSIIRTPAATAAATGPSVSASSGTSGASLLAELVAEATAGDWAALVPGLAPLPPGAGQTAEELLAGLDLQEVFAPPKQSHAKRIRGHVRRAAELKAQLADRVRAIQRLAAENADLRGRSRVMELVVRCRDEQLRTLQAYRTSADGKVYYVPDKQLGELLAAATAGGRTGPGGKAALEAPPLEEAKPAAEQQQQQQQQIVVAEAGAGAGGARKPGGMAALANMPASGLLEMFRMLVSELSVNLAAVENLESSGLGQRGPQDLRGQAALPAPGSPAGLVTQMSMLGDAAGAGAAGADGRGEQLSLVPLMGPAALAVATGASGCDAAASPMARLCGQIARFRSIIRYLGLVNDEICRFEDTRLTGETGPPEPGHWLRVVQSLGLTQQQLADAAALYGCLQDWMGRLLSERRSIASALGQLLSVNRYGAAYSEAVGQYGTDRDAIHRIHANVMREKILVVLAGEVLCCHILTDMQWARAIVQSYPYVMDVRQVVRAAAELYYSTGRTGLLQGP